MSKAIVDEMSYHGVDIAIHRDHVAGGLQFEEVAEIVDHYLKNAKGEYLRRLDLIIDEDDQIELQPTYSRKAIDRIKKAVPPPTTPNDIPVPDIPLEREIVKPWPKPQGGAR